MHQNEAATRREYKGIDVVNIAAVVAAIVITGIVLESCISVNTVVRFDVSTLSRRPPCVSSLSLMSTWFSQHDR